MSTADELNAIMARQEDLDPELEAYFEEDGPLGFPSVRHPLVYSVPHLSNALANYQLKMKKEGLREAKRKRNWSQFVFLHERPYRINAFAYICHRMGDAKYWELLGNIWTDTENLWQNEELWIECLTAERRYRSHLMSADERKALANDIDKKDGTIYRGFTLPGKAEGLSWTTNSIVAKFFARRLAPPGNLLFLATGKVDRRDVIAFFEGRSEYEIVVLPHNVHDIKVEEIRKDKDDQRPG